MNASNVTLTMVEHGGRRWLCGADGSIVAEVKGEVGPCAPAEAVKSVRAALTAEQRRDAFLGDLESERTRRERWQAAITKAASEAQNAARKLSELDNEWARRIDGCRQSIRLMVKRGSNLRERSPYEPRYRTWERMLADAFRRSVQWHDDAWGTYSNNLASNLRKRFRNAGARTAGPLRGRGHVEEVDDSSDPRSPGLQVLFDWG